MIHAKIILYYLLLPIYVILGNQEILCVNGIKVNILYYSFIEFFINFPADKIYTPQTVILFQLLDFNHQALLYKDNSQYDKDNFYRIAWAYLRPAGISKPHLGTKIIYLQV